MVAVVLLVVPGQVTAVAGRADGGAGVLVAAVGQDEDLAGETGLGDPVSTGCGQAVRPPGAARVNNRVCRRDVR